MRRKKLLKPILISLAVIVGFALLVFGSSRLESVLAKRPDGAETAPSLSSRSENASDPIGIVTFEGRDYRPNDNLSVLLIIGVDDYGVTETDAGRNTSQSDFLTLALFDRDARIVRLVQLNRDTMTDVPVLDGNGELYGMTFQQLALAHTYGSGLEDSCENTEFAVSRLLYGVPIDNYFAVTMDVIPILNDLVGGVTVTIEDNFAGVDDSLALGSTITLTGSQAETYVRARRGMQDDPTNIARMRRQRIYMTGLAEGLSREAENGDSFVLDAYSAMSDYLVTDCTIDALCEYAEQFSDYTLEDIVTPEGESVRGEKNMEFYIDEQALQQLVIDLFYVPID